MRARGWLVVVALVAVGSGGVALRSSSSSRPRSPSSFAQAPAEIEAAATKHADEMGGRTRERPTASAPTATAAEASGVDAAAPFDTRFEHRAERVSQAIAMLRFPPTSQPLRRDMRDVLEPNRRWETPQPLSLAQGGSLKDPPKDDLSFELTGDVFTVVGSSPLTATLEVFHARDHQRIPIEVTATSLVAVDSGKVVASDVPLTDTGEHVYRASVSPASLEGLRGYRGAVRFDVGFVPSEGDRRPANASLDFRYAGVTPATFSGVTGEKRVAEGLEIDVGVEVAEAGLYFIQGCIFDDKGEPLGFAVARPSLQVGIATVPLVFFGLIFRDANASGPFVFKTLTGNRLPSLDEADHAPMEAWSGTYRTKAYAVSDFSDHEYESPQKDAKIRALSDLAAKGRSREAPSGE